MISKNNVLNLETRQKIFKMISKNPGLNFREISRRSNIPITTLNYHLRVLKKSEIITIKSDNKYNRYFVVNEIKKRDREILDILRRETPRNILLYLGFYGAASQIEISIALGKTSAAIGFHIKRLKDLEIVDFYNQNKKVKINTNFKDIVLRRNKKANEILYYLSGRDYFTNLIIKYTNTLKNEIIDIPDTSSKDIMGFIEEIFQYFQIEEKNIKKVNNLDCAIDSVVDFLEDFIPLPVCA